MCSTTAPQGMQGVSFFAETEERKQARIISPEIAWIHTHQTLCRLAFTTEITKQTGERSVFDRDLLRAPFLGPVLVKPRSSTTVSPKCIQSQNLSPNTSPPRSIHWKPIKMPSATSRRPCTHARPGIPRTTTGGIGGARRGISCRRQVFNFFQAPGLRPRNCGVK